jgi:hypothetical protein
VVLLMPEIGFLIIGAPKAGTTSLFEYMRVHPQIHMPAEKELYFFNMDRSYRRGWDWYSAAILRGAPPGAICGEATTEYMSGAPYTNITDQPDRGRPPEDTGDDESLEEVIPRRIEQVLPDVKLICVLRDPVARAYSHYRMMALGGVESRTFEEVVDQLLDPAVLKHTRVARSRDNGYVINGEYARLLAGFLRVFPREQLMAIFSDELAQSPRQVLAHLFEFIGASPDFLPDNLDTRYRAAATKQRIPGLNLVTWQMGMARVRSARALWHALPDRLQRTIDHAYSVTNYRVELWNAWRGAVDDDMPPAMRERLIAHFRPDSEALADLLDRDIPWLATWEGQPAAQAVETNVEVKTNAGYERAR